MWLRRGTFRIIAARTLPALLAAVVLFGEVPHRCCLLEGSCGKASRPGGDGAASCCGAKPASRAIETLAAAGPRCDCEVGKPAILPVAPGVPVVEVAAAAAPLLCAPSTVNLRPTIASLARAAPEPPPVPLHLALLTLRI
jgi:hypothetical protein